MTVAIIIFDAFLIYAFVQQDRVDKTSRVGVELVDLKKMKNQSWKWA